MSPSSGAAIEDYFDRKAGPADLALVVEVADSSYDDDRRKRLIYAEAGIPSTGSSNLDADRIEVYSDPTGPDASPRVPLPPRLWDRASRSRC